jgi:hypothetical protein
MLLAPAPSDSQSKYQPEAVKKWTIPDKQLRVNHRRNPALVVALGSLHAVDR